MASLSSINTLILLSIHLLVFLSSPLTTTCIKTPQETEQQQQQQQQKQALPPEGEGVVSQDSESDRVINLPGQPSAPSISHFSGYITVNEAHGRALFYWFFEAQSQPSQRPLLLWFNGGPGCSSVGYGAAVELGPLRVDTNGTGLLYNKHAWNQEANLLFVESPVGVGFSYTDTSSDLSMLDDAFVAEDAYSFLVNWLQKFPQFKTHDCFLAGESYAGHYVPQLAELIYDRNKDTAKYTPINLKGFIVGNPETNDYYDYKAVLEYAWSHAVISDQLYHKCKRACNFTVSDWSDECNEGMNTVFTTYQQEIDIYNIYAPTCLLNSSSASSSLSHRSESHFEPLTKVNGYSSRTMRIPGGYDPCFTQYAEMYLNRQDVQSSLHVRTVNSNTISWKACNQSLGNTYSYSVFSVLPIYTKLIKGGLKIWVYSGDTDGRVPVIGSRYCVEALGLSIKSPWRSWYHDHQVAGRMVEYEGGLALVTVRGAGHLVPLDKPSEALALLHSFLTGQDLRRQR
ncbi:serine carboxypeptidase-like 33 [Eucalyptus grandis]|uniref:serine carboxypeptidase-like 33 n=1 Tax=Eucalyptus grandis TaxID=71139 RepID=UPI00192F0671|nr:serine carboxypeptidase-like 33 [Eucalyptus grandis]